jgi:lysyl-tRNA synthetase class 2
MSELQQDEQEQIKQRRSKLNELRENGGIAFPTDFRRNVVAGELLAEYGEKSKEELEAEPLVKPVLRIFRICQAKCSCM